MEFNELYLTLGYIFSLMMGCSLTLCAELIYMPNMSTSICLMTSIGVGYVCSYMYYMLIDYRK